MTLKDELPSSVGVQYATEEPRNSSRRNEEVEPNRKQCPGVDVSGDKVKSDAVKNNIAYEPGVLDPWVKVIWKWSIRR